MCVFNTLAITLFIYEYWWKISRKTSTKPSMFSFVIYFFFYLIKYYSITKFLCHYLNDQALKNKVIYISTTRINCAHVTVNVLNIIEMCGIMSNNA